MSNFKIGGESKNKVTLNNENSKSSSNNDSGANNDKPKLKASTEEIKSRRTEASITENYWAKKLNRIVDNSATKARETVSDSTTRKVSFRASVVDDGNGGAGAAQTFLTKEEYERRAAQDSRLKIPEAGGNSYEDAQTVARWLNDAPPEMRGEMLHRVLEDGLKSDNGDGFEFLSNLNAVSDSENKAAVTDAFNRGYDQAPGAFSDQLKNLAVRLGNESLTSQKLSDLTYVIGNTGNQDLIADFSKDLLEGAKENDLPFLANMATASLLNLDNQNLKEFVNANANLMPSMVDMAIDQSNRTGVNSGGVVAELLDRLTESSQTPGAGEKQLFLAVFNSDSATGRHYGDMREAVRNFVEKFPSAAIDALKTLPNGTSGNFLSNDVMNRLERLGAIPSFDNPVDIDNVAGWLNKQNDAMKAEYMNWMMSSETGRSTLKGYTGSLSPEQQQVFADALNAAYEKDPDVISGKINDLNRTFTFPGLLQTGDGFSEIVALTRNEKLIVGYVEDNLNQGNLSQYGQQSLNNAGTALTGLSTSEFQSFLAKHSTNRNSTTPYDYKIQNLVAQLSSEAYAGDALGKLLDKISNSKTVYDYYDTANENSVYRVSDQGLNFFELAVKNAGNSRNPFTTDGIVNFFANNASAVANWAGTNTDNQKTLTSFFQNYVLNHDPKDANDPITRKLFGTYQGEVDGVPVYSGGALNNLFSDIKSRIAQTNDPSRISDYGYQMGVVLGSLVKASENLQEHSDNARQLAADRWGAIAAFLSSPIEIPVKGIGFGVSDVVGQIAKETYLALNDPSSIEDFGKTFKQEFFNRLQAKLNTLYGRETEFRALETFFDAIDRGYNAVND